MMRIRSIFMSLVAIAALSACETVEGAGRDIKSAGEAITDESVDAQTGY
jgi:entericidin B